MKYYLQSGVNKDKISNLFLQSYITQSINCKYSILHVIKSRWQMSHCFKYNASEFKTCLEVIFAKNHNEVAKSICYDNTLFVLCVSRWKNDQIFVVKYLFSYHIPQSLELYEFEFLWVKIYLNTYEHYTNSYVNDYSIPFTA